MAKANRLKKDLSTTRPKPIEGQLILEDGSRFNGLKIGSPNMEIGEVCFNTSMTGYQEIITDPSYAGQIINFTFPHIGNVGTNLDDDESRKPFAKGIIINCDISEPSNYRSILNLDAWLKKNNIPYIICFTDPTAGGITASFAMLGDISIAEPNSLIAFAGRRVIQATVKEDLSADFQTSEFCEKHGFVDRIVPRKDLRKDISNILSILLKRKSGVNSESLNESSENIEPITKAAS